MWLLCFESTIKAAQDERAVEGRSYLSDVKRALLVRAAEAVCYVGPPTMRLAFLPSGLGYGYGGGWKVTRLYPLRWRMEKQRLFELHLQGEFRHEGLY